MAGRTFRSPGVLRLPEFSRQPAHEGGKVVSPTHLPPLPPGDISGFQLCNSSSRHYNYAHNKVRILDNVELYTLDI
jgi:hypothetical protein